VFYLLNIAAGIFAIPHGNPGREAISLHIATGCYVVVTILFFDLFRPVNPALSGVAAHVSLAGCMDLAPSTINALVYFGVYCLLTGFLIFRSTFLPPFLGILMAIGGLGWLTFLSRALAHRLSPYNMLPGVLGEGVLTVWLVVVGLNAERWRERAKFQPIDRQGLRKGRSPAHPGEVLHRGPGPL
jgi:hypothetical protein